MNPDCPSLYPGSAKLKWQWFLELASGSRECQGMCWDYVYRGPQVKGWRRPQLTHCITYPFRYKTCQKSILHPLFDEVHLLHCVSDTSWVANSIPLDRSSNFGAEVLESWKKVENAVVSISSVGLSVDNEAIRDAQVPVSSFGMLYGTFRVWQ